MTSPETHVRILVTGAGGNLAEQLIQSLEARGLDGKRIEWLLTDLHRPRSLETLSVASLSAADLANPAALVQLLHAVRPAVVLHVGSLLSGTSAADLGRSWAINTTASLALLEAAAEGESCRFFFPSTGATYAAGAADPGADDDARGGR